MLAGLDRVGLVADLGEQALQVADAEKITPIEPVRVPGVRDDLVAGRAEVVAAGGGHVAEQSDEGNLLLLLHAPDAGCKSPARRRRCRRAS